MLKELLKGNATSDRHEFLSHQWLFPWDRWRNLANRIPKLDKETSLDAYAQRRILDEMKTTDVNLVEICGISIDGCDLWTTMYDRRKLRSFSIQEISAPLHVRTKIRIPVTCEMKYCLGHFCWPFIRLFSDVLEMQTFQVLSDALIQLVSWVSPPLWMS
jgi:hypothetical protein